MLSNRNIFKFYVCKSIFSIKLLDSFIIYYNSCGCLAETQAPQCWRHRTVEHRFIITSFSLLSPFFCLFVLNYFTATVPSTPDKRQHEGKIQYKALQSQLHQLLTFLQVPSKEKTFVNLRNLKKGVVSQYELF